MAGLHASGNLNDDYSNSAGPAPAPAPAPADTPKPTTMATTAFAMGEKVEARFAGGADYYRGVIMGVHPNTQTYDIVYDDGDGESQVASSLIRKLGAPPVGNTATSAANNTTSGGPGNSNKGTASTFAVGTEVEVRGFKGGWRPGNITTIREEGSFDITLQDGTMEKGVPPSLVRLRGQSVTDGSGGKENVQSGRNHASSTQSGDVKLATARAALKLSASTKKEKALREELEMLLMAYERQTRTVDKNKTKITSLKAKISELEQLFAEGTSV